MSDTTSNFSGAIEWGDGTITDFTSSNVTGSNGAFTVSGSYLYAEEGTYSVGVIIDDTNGSSTTDTGSATVADAALTAGSIAVNGATEGVSQGNLTATFTDADLSASATDFSGTINWGDGTSTNFNNSAVIGSNGAFTVLGFHSYTEAGSDTVTVKINDVGGSTTTDTGTATIADAPIEPGTASVTNSTEGLTASTLTATFTDLDTHDVTTDFSGVINWGDGTTTNFTNSAVTGSNGALTVSGSHTYAEAGSYSATVRLNDVAGSTATDGSNTITVADATLTAGTATLTGGVEGMTATTLSATFSDADLGAPTSDFSGTINWGDGTSTNFTSAAVSGSGGAYTVSGSHTLRGRRHLRRQRDDQRRWRQHDDATVAPRRFRMRR